MMKTAKRPLVFLRPAAFFLMAFLVVGCEMRERGIALRLLLATNAPRSVVESTLGCRFQITARDSPSWVGRAPTNASLWQRIIAEKAQRSAAVGHTSTIDLQTYIFLDDRDRLIDFEVGSQ